MAESAISDVYRSLGDVPFGAGEGESALLRPRGGEYKDRQVLVYARNLSAVRPRRVVDEYVSFWRGGEKLVATKYKNQGKSLDALQLQARVRDMNAYKDEIQEQPVVFLVWDGQRFAIPSRGKDDKGEEVLAPWTMVPPGVMDLYVGNWDRLHSKDVNEAAKEIARVRASRLNYVIDAAKPEANPFGFIEFLRKEITPQSVAVDEQIYSGEIIEI